MMHAAESPWQMRPAIRKAEANAPAGAKPTSSAPTMDAGLPDAGGHLVAGGLETVRGDSRRSVLLHRELGVGMNVLVESLELRQQLVQTSEGGAGGRRGLRTHGIGSLYP
jgi:hypothetical protein